MDSKLLVGLIKEVVKNEVKQQVKEELAKLIKSGAVTLNSQKKSVAPTLREAIDSVDPFVAANSALQQSRKSIQQPVQQRPQPKQPMKEYTSNAALNEVLNMTTPFTAAQRAEGGMPGTGGGSVLDMLQPERYEEDGWDTMDYRMEQQIPQSMPQQFESTGNSLQDATLKALTRDYTALTKVFAKQEQEKRSR